MKWGKFSILLIALALASCGDSNQGIEQTNNKIHNEGHDSASSSDNGPVSTFKISSRRAVVLEHDLSNIDHFAKNINYHYITVEASRGNNKGGLLTCRKDTANSFNNEWSASFSSYGTSAERMVSLEEMDKDTVTFDCKITNSNGATLHNFQQDISKGYVISQVQDILKIGSAKIDTLILMKNSELLFGGQKTTLTVNTLISNDAHLSTFTKYSVEQTPANQHGESGSTLKLVVGEMIGELTINLRGKNGGIQTDRPQRPAKNNGRGADGKCPRRCDGGQGPRGYPANDGYPGFNGGGTGAINLKIDQKTDAIITVNYIPGRGSEGSAPSLPGLGGEGGRGMTYTLPCIDPRFTMTKSNKCIGGVVTGQNGAQGALGSEGLPGETGRDGETSISSYVNIEEGVEETFNRSRDRL